MALKSARIYIRTAKGVGVQTVDVNPEDYDLQPGYVRYKSTEELWIVVPMSEITKIEERVEAKR
jgi:hypothetical protein